MLHNTTQHKTATKQKRGKATQQIARTVAQANRLANKGLPTQVIQGVQKQGLKRATKIARNNPKPKPTTNRYTPKLQSKKHPNGTALGIARLCHTYSLKNGLGQYMQHVAYPLATCTAHNTATGVYTFVIKQRNSTPAQLIQVYTQSPFSPGYSIITWLK